MAKRNVTEKRSEIVVGLVAPTGIDLSSFENDFKDHARKFDYKVRWYKLSEGLKEPGITKIHRVEIKESTRFNRVRSLMDAGDAFRQSMNRGDAVVLPAMVKILEERKEKTRALPNTIHVLESLKHPEEVKRLRSVYGIGFILLGLHSSVERRTDYLMQNKSFTEDEAEEAMTRDEYGSTEFGQKMRDTFELADAFISLEEHERSKRELWRILDLVFGDPFLSPTKDEHAMYLAYASSFRSADLSRQVGAVVLSANGELIATGANEVPMASGGQYFTEASLSAENDHRDYILGYESNAKYKQEVLSQLSMRLMEKKMLSEEWSSDFGGVWAEIEACLQRTPLSSLTEFGRAVHAEMEALIACARIGVSPVGGTLYTTTFPCHNCAKHIIDAGIKRVVFVEPYPKSKALDLHSDGIILGSPLEADHSAAAPPSRVIFEPFVGVGVRRYVDLFSMRLGSGTPVDRKKGAVNAKWERKTARPRLEMLPTSYIDREDSAVIPLKHITNIHEADQGGKKVIATKARKRKVEK